MPTRRLAHFARLLGAGAGLLALTAAAPDRAPFVPVMRVDFPDPFILKHGADYLAYATNADRINVPMATSKDLANWSQIRAASGGGLHDAMPTLPAWAKRGFTWAPEVIAAGNGAAGKGYVLYFTARHAKSNRQCVGTATAANPRGPFVATASEPLVCQLDQGGTIDANPFRDADGKLYLYYKNDGNAIAKPTDIWAHRLSADGEKLVGDSVAVLRNDGAWEAHVIEAPTMVRTPAGGYAMFFSANHYGWETHQRLSPYAMGYATCTSAMGPCTDAPDNPILFSRMGAAGCISGPGHQSIFQAGGRSFISYHAWDATSGCRKNDNRRFMYISPLVWTGGKPEVRMSIRPVATSR